MNFDLVVVGAGLTGLTAAYRCAQAGKKVIVLEARDRVGGRTYTITDTQNGSTNHFDLGAHFIGKEKFQAPVWDLVAELGLDVFKQYEGPENEIPTPEKFWAGEGANLQGFGFDTGSPQVDAYIGTTIPPTDAGKAYIVYLEQLSQSIWLSDPARSQNAEVLDNLSVWDWVCTIDLPGYGPPVVPPDWTGETHGNAPNQFRALTRMLCRVGFSAEPENISMLWLLFYVKSSGGLARFQSLRWPVEGAQGYRLKEGAQSIAKRLAHLLAGFPDCRVVTGAEITSVKDAGTGVEVRDRNGNAYSGSRALIAMAPALNAGIEFTPALPDARRHAIAQMPNSHMIMTFVTFDSPFWRNDRTRYQSGSVNGLPISGGISEFGLSGDALMADGDIVWVMDNTAAEGQAALFAFIVGDAARRLSKQDEKDRQAVVLETMGTLFGADEVAANHPRYFELDWNKEAFSMGCPAGHFLPGQFLNCADGVLLSRLGPRPFGNIHFASTEAATISNGYMSGAVWSGERVAKDIRRALGDDLPPTFDPLAREMAMTDCVNQIMRAIEVQNPMMEWPALTDDCAFKGPGGTTLPTAPEGATAYVGRQGTVEFYTRMGFFFTITNVRVLNIAVNVDADTALASFTVDGVVNTNGKPFRAMYGTMIFEFTDVSAGAPLIRADRLVMDSAMIDTLVAAPPQLPGEQPELSGDPLAERARALVDWLNGGSDGSIDEDFEHAIVYGPGGTTLPRGPFYGPAGLRQVFSPVTNGGLFRSATLTSVAADIEGLAMMAVYDVSGVSASSQTPFDTQLVCTWRFQYMPNLRTVEFGVSMDGTLLD